MKKGLTLIEVLIAAAILGLSLTVLLTAASRCLAVMKRAKVYQTAQWALNLGELEHPLSPTNNLEDMRVSPETYPNGCTYSREVEDKDPADKDCMYVVRSRVTWQTGRRDQYEEIVRYVYIPQEQRRQ